MFFLYFVGWSVGQKQLRELMEILNETEPHYIRCIKPNHSKKARVLERKLVMSQLRSGGVLEAVRMCSTGYPTKRSFEDFVDRFWVLAHAPRDPKLTEQQLCRQLMKQTQLEDYQVKTTEEGWGGCCSVLSAQCFGGSVVLWFGGCRSG